MLRFQSEPFEPLVKALEHPIRAKILAILGERSASAAEIAKSIGEPAAKVRYHLRALVKSGLIRWDGTKDRRGAREYSWIAKTPWWIAGDQFARMSPEQIRLLTLYGLRLIFGDAAAGLREGAFARRPDHWLIWSRPHVDERGWKELVTIYRDALTGIEEVRERAARRLTESGEDPLPVSASLLLFDLEAPG
jgi:DNA-binding transcriptional ArsR family regulator